MNTIIPTASENEEVCLDETFVRYTVKLNADELKLEVSSDFSRGTIQLTMLCSSLWCYFIKVRLLCNSLASKREVEPLLFYDIFRIVMSLIFYLEDVSFQWLCLSVNPSGLFYVGKSGISVAQVEKTFQSDSY